MWVSSSSANSSAVVTSVGGLQPSLAQYHTRHSGMPIGWVLGPRVAFCLIGASFKLQGVFMFLTNCVN